MATTTNLSTLKINYLTQAQYNTALANNQINDDELYLTPDEIITVTPSITNVTSGATISDISAAITGKVCTLTFTAVKTSAVNAGADVLTATLNDYKPKVAAAGIGYYGSSGLICRITNAGALTIRNIGATLAANSTFAVSITYVMA